MRKQWSVSLSSQNERRPGTLCLRSSSPHLQVGNQNNANSMLQIPRRKDRTLSIRNDVCVLCVCSDKAWGFWGLVSAHASEEQQHCRWYGDWAGARDCARSGRSCVSVSKNLPFIYPSLSANRGQQTVNYWSFSKFQHYYSFRSVADDIPCENLVGGQLKKRC